MAETLTLSHDRVLRDWQPGDGLLCSNRRQSPVPCGMPLRTLVSQVSNVGRPAHETKRPLCVLHAVGIATGQTPGKLRAEADRRAHQQLAHDHWDEFTELRDSALDALIKGATSGSDS